MLGILGFHDFRIWDFYPAALGWSLKVSVTSPKRSELLTHVVESVIGTNVPQQLLIIQVFNISAAFMV